MINTPTDVESNRLCALLKFSRPMSMQLGQFLNGNCKFQVLSPDASSLALKNLEKFFQAEHCNVITTKTIYRHKSRHFHPTHFTHETDETNCPDPASILNATSNIKMVYTTKPLTTVSSCVNWRQQNVIYNLQHEAISS